MAKISARGAKEVARKRIGNYTYVACSDGRILNKLHYEDGTSSGYVVKAKVKKGKDVRGVFERWMKKALDESILHKLIVVCLVPVRSDTSWWHDYAMKATEIRFIRGRLSFGDSKGSAPFGANAVVIFDGTQVFESEWPRMRGMER